MQMLSSPEHHLALASYAISGHLHAFFFIFRIWRQKLNLETSKKIQKNMFQKFFWRENFRKPEKCVQKSKFKISKSLQHVKLVKMAENHDFSNVVAQNGATRFFTENPAVLGNSLYAPLSSCKKAKNSIVGKYHNFCRTNY